MNTNIYLVRHGHDGHSTSGSRDLTAAGVAQAQLLGQWLGRTGAHVLVSSGMVRAQHTAEVMLRSLGAPVLYLVDDRLSEVGHDRNSGSPPRLCRSADGSDVWSVFVSKVADLIREMVARYPGRSLVMVAHSGVFDAVLELAGGVRGSIELIVNHGGITHWQHRAGDPAGEWLLCYHNFDIHSGVR